MSKKKKAPQLPPMHERIARWGSFGPLSLSLSHLPLMAGRINPRTERAVAAQPGGVGVIPFRGVVVPREDAFSKWMGEVGVEDTVARIAAMLADNAVKVIILDVESPGGSVSGVTEAVAAVRAMPRNKLIIAHADYLMASAAYHFSMCADEIDANPTAQVGCVGVLAPFMDQQKMLAELGIEFTSFAMPEDKGDGWGYWQNTAKFAPRREQEVAEAYKIFVDDILASRPDMTREAILADWAGCYNAPRAKLLGMVDKVRPIAETFGAYSNPESTGAPVSLLRRQLELNALKQPMKG